MAGPKDTFYETGIYHGRILLPPEYPFKPPSFLFLTENGRFQTNTKICLTISNYHPEYWQPAWGIRTALMAIISMFPVKDPASLGSLVSTTDDIMYFAKKSREYICPSCGASNGTIWRERQEFQPSNSVNTVKKTSTADASTAEDGVPEKRISASFKPENRTQLETSGQKEIQAKLNTCTTFDYLVAFSILLLCFSFIAYYLA